MNADTSLSLAGRRYVVSARSGDPTWQDPRRRKTIRRVDATWTSPWQVSFAPWSMDSSLIDHPLAGRQYVVSEPFQTSTCPSTTSSTSSKCHLTARRKSFCRLEPKFAPGTIFNKLVTRGYGQPSVAQNEHDRHVPHPQHLSTLLVVVVHSVHSALLDVHDARHRRARRRGRTSSSSSLTSHSHNQTWPVYISGERYGAKAGGLESSFWVCSHYSRTSDCVRREACACEGRVSGLDASPLVALLRDRLGCEGLEGRRRRLHTVKSAIVAALRLSSLSSMSGAKARSARFYPSYTNPGSTMTTMPSSLRRVDSCAVTRTQTAQCYAACIDQEDFRSPSLVSMPLPWVCRWACEPLDQYVCTAAQKTPKLTVTYLHHSDPTIPHYRKGEWTFLRGAAATVDRPLLGWFGRFFFHNISHDHVAHHFFLRAPFSPDNGPQITSRIKAVLGEDYNYDSTPSFYALYRSFTQCLFVEEDGDIVFYKNRKGEAARVVDPEFLKKIS
ncbi:hypothetical protein D9611_014406 [Ephemerocybe angulata]|uniref:Uncharacterized protein n=1 Tax=Ephemerocybe angulata TaxID=980116 RepID=A0A8H5AS84_9AGAR|nr:hypothetical protein D9611_014406 [Tulosesus angulatus]